MRRVPFETREIGVLAQAIDVSEELISDFYKISTSEWKRYRYDIQSLSTLYEEEITDIAFAQIRRYLRRPGDRTRGSEPGDFFKICIQDHVIRMAVAEDDRLDAQRIDLQRVEVVQQALASAARVQEDGAALLPLPDAQEGREPVLGHGLKALEDIVSEIKQRKAIRPGDTAE